MWQNESNATWNAQQHIITSHTAPAVRDSSVELDHIFLWRNCFSGFSLWCAPAALPRLSVSYRVSWRRRAVSEVVNEREPGRPVWTELSLVARYGPVLTSLVQVTFAWVVCSVCMNLTLTAMFNPKQSFPRCNTVVTCWVLFVVSM